MLVHAMRLRTVLIAFLAIWGLFAMAGLRSCNRPGREDWEPEHPPSLDSTDPSEATQAYWLAARRVYAKAAEAMTTREQLQRAVNTQDAAEASRLWAEAAQAYVRAARANAEAIDQLRSLPTDRADPIAVECVKGLTELLALQEVVLRKSGDQCGDMAVLVAEVHTQGGTFDSKSPSGKAFEKWEANILASMKEILENEGVAEKQHLRNLSIKIQTARKTLSEKHDRGFPHLLGN